VEGFILLRVLGVLGGSKTLIPCAGALTGIAFWMPTYENRKRARRHATALSTDTARINLAAGSELRICR